MLVAMSNPSVHRYSKRSDSAASATNHSPTDTALPPKEEESPNIMVYKRMESFLERMQDPHSGVVVRTVKSFMSKIPSVFTGTDLITWMMRTLDVDDTTEALHLANLMCAHGYIFPIEDHILTVKNDGAYYRFQTPCFWPSKVTEPENTDYAVYLCKRTMQNKQRLELADYEAENLARLQKMFSRKWEFIFLQAEAQAKVDKKRDKLERKVLDSQERAFWDVHRPAPGCVNTTEVDIKKACRTNRLGKRNGKVSCGLLGSMRQSSSVEVDLGRALASYKAEIERLHNLIERCRIKISKVAERHHNSEHTKPILCSRCFAAGILRARFWSSQYSEFDPLITPLEPSNPWLSDNIEFWDQESTTKDIPQRRVKRWGFSVRELLRDPAGREHFRKFLEKEFSAENLKFWEACQRLKCLSQAEVPAAVQDIYNEYLASGARDPINVDCKVSEAAKRKVVQQPDRYCFVEAEEHIYQLMKNDSYSRYLRSDMYKEFLSGTKKKSKRCFASEVRRLCELSKATAAAAAAAASSVPAVLHSATINASLPLASMATSTFHVSATASAGHQPVAASNSMSTTTTSAAASHLPPLATSHPHPASANANLSMAHTPSKSDSVTGHSAAAAKAAPAGAVSPSSAAASSAAVDVEAKSPTTRFTGAGLVSAAEAIADVITVDGLDKKAMTSSSSSPERPREVVDSSSSTVFVPSSDENGKRLSPASGDLAVESSLHGVGPAVAAEVIERADPLVVVVVVKEADDDVVHVVDKSNANVHEASVAGVDESATVAAEAPAGTSDTVGAETAAAASRTQAHQSSSKEPGDNASESNAAKSSLTGPSCKRGPPAPHSGTTTNKESESERSVLASDGTDGRSDASRESASSHIPPERIASDNDELS